MPIDSLVPAGARLSVVLTTFVILLVVFHLVFVRWVKLGPRAWKRTDYVWLGFATLGLSSAAAHARIASASVQVNAYENRVHTAFEHLRNQVELCATEPGIVCRTFIRSEASPPADQFAELQREHDAACEWARQVRDSIAQRDSQPLQRLDKAVLPAAPEVSNVALAETIQDIYARLERFNSTLQAVRTLNDMNRQTAAEQVLVYLGQFLLAAALALRITKVTGELRAA